MTRPCLAPRQGERWDGPTIRAGINSSPFASEIAKAIRCDTGAEFISKSMKLRRTPSGSPSLQPTYQAKGAYSLNQVYESLGVQSQTVGRLWRQPHFLDTRS